METGEALTGLMKLMPVILISTFAIIRLHPVLFMFAGGAAIITGCYMPDIINGGVTDNVGLMAGLVMFGCGWTFFGFAFGTMFMREP